MRWRFWRDATERGVHIAKCASCGHEGLTAAMLRAGDPGTYWHHRCFDWFLTGAEARREAWEKTYDPVRDGALIAWAREYRP